MKQARDMEVMLETIYTPQLTKNIVQLLCADVQCGLFQLLCFLNIVFNFIKQYLQPRKKDPGSDFNKLQNASAQ